MAIDITGLDRADVLAALFNASRPQGMGFLHYDPTDMTREAAAMLLQRQNYFDYLQGRVMKIELKEGATELREGLYDRDNGQGAAQRVIDSLRATQSVTNSVIDEIHRSGVSKAIKLATEAMGQKTTYEKGVVTLGLDDVKDKLKPIVDAHSDERN